MLFHVLWHSLTETFGNLNKGHGRSYRRKTFGKVITVVQ